MAIYKFILALVLLFAISQAQRPFYTGLRPIGYREVESNANTNRLDEYAGLPIEARGDGNLINRLNELPVDKKPVWYLNWRQYDALRRNSQTYQLRPNGFVDRNTIR